MNTVLITEDNVSIKEYRGNRVITFKDVDTVHGRPDGTARRNFNQNKEHFIEGEDYFVRNSSEVKEYGIIAPNGLTLLTESGYLMLAKSFTDKKAWDVQRALVKCYFRAKTPEPQHEQPKLTEKPYEYFDKYYNGALVLTVEDITHLIGTNTTSIKYRLLSKAFKEGADYFFLSGEQLAAFKKQNPKLNKSVSHLNIVTKSGFDKLCRAFGVKVEMPKVIEKKPIPQKSTDNSVNECVVALGVLGDIRNTLNQIKNSEAVGQVDGAIKYVAWKLSMAATK
jgi:hypothetical protein